MPLYLDYSATTPVHPDVLAEMISVYKSSFGNASSRTHSFGQDAARIVDHARGEVASVLGVDKREVVFTSGATESDNLAILGLADWGESAGRKHIVSTQIEHNAVLEPLKSLRSRGFEVTLVRPTADGRVSADSVLEVVRQDTLLVSVMHVNNETGIVQPVTEIGEALSGTEVYFHVDAAQSFGKLLSETISLKYDFLSISSHKIYGPQGIGALVVRRRDRQSPPLHSIMYGGGQENGLRPGTLPVALIAGLGRAAVLAKTNHHQWWADWTRTRDNILYQLQDVNFALNGDLNYGLPTILNLSIQGVDSEALMLGLRDDLAVSNGSACSSASYKPSHVLQAMGLSSNRISESVRFSWGHGMTALALDSLISFVRRFSDRG